MRIISTLLNPKRAAVSLIELIIGSALGAGLILGTLLLISTFTSQASYSSIRGNLVVEANRLESLFKEQFNRAIRFTQQDGTTSTEAAEIWGIRRTGGAPSVATEPDTLQIYRGRFDSFSLSTLVTVSAAGEPQFTYDFQKSTLDTGTGNSVISRLDCGTAADENRAECIFEDAFTNVSAVPEFYLKGSQHALGFVRSSSMAASDTGSNKRITTALSSGMLDDLDWNGVQAELGILERRDFQVTGSALEMIVNNETSTPIKLSDRISQFKVEYQIQDFTGRGVACAGSGLWFRHVSEATGSVSGCEDGENPNWGDIGRVKVTLKLCDDLPSGLSSLELASANSAPFSVNSNDQLCYDKVFEVGPELYFSNVDVQYVDEFSDSGCTAADKCDSNCDKFFNATDRSSDRWKGYRSSSDYCICGTKSGVFKENYFTDAASDPIVWDHDWFTVAGRTALESCFANWGCKYGHDYNELNERTIGDGFNPDFNHWKYDRQWDHPGAYMLCAGECVNNKLDATTNAVTRAIRDEAAEIANEVTGYGFTYVLTGQLSEVSDTTGPSDGNNPVFGDSSVTGSADNGSPYIGCGNGALRRFSSTDVNHPNRSYCYAAAMDWTNSTLGTNYAVDDLGSEDIWYNTCSCRTHHFDFNANPIQQIPAHLIEWEYVCGVLEQDGSDALGDGWDDTTPFETTNDRWFDGAISAPSDCSNAVAKRSTAYAGTSDYAQEIFVYQRHDVHPDQATDNDPSGQAYANYHAFGHSEETEAMCRCMRKSIDSLGGLETADHSTPQSQHGGQALGLGAATQHDLRWSASWWTNMRDYSSAAGDLLEFVEISLDWRDDGPDPGVTKWVPSSGLSVSGPDIKTYSCPLLFANQDFSHEVNSCAPPMTAESWENPPAGWNEYIQWQGLTDPDAADLAWVLTMIDFHFNESDTGVPGSAKSYVGTSVVLNSDGDPASHLNGHDFNGDLTVDLNERKLHFLASYYESGSLLPIPGLGATSPAGDTTVTTPSGDVINVPGGTTGNNFMAGAAKLRVFCHPSCRAGNRQIPRAPAPGAGVISNFGNFDEYRPTTPPLTDFDGSYFYHTARRFATGAPWKSTSPSGSYPGPSFCPIEDAPQPSVTTAGFYSTGQGY